MVCNKPNMHGFRIWEEARVPVENPHNHRKNLLTPHRSALAVPGVKKLLTMWS